MRLEITCGLEQVWYSLWGSLSVRSSGGFEMLGGGLSSGPDRSCLLVLQMACEAGRSPLGMFECQLCALTAPYSYVGQRPPYPQSIV